MVFDVLKFGAFYKINLNISPHIPNIFWCDQVERRNQYWGTYVLWLTRNWGPGRLDQWHDPMVTTWRKLYVYLDRDTKQYCGGHLPSRFFFCATNLYFQLCSEVVAVSTQWIHSPSWNRKPISIQIVFMLRAALYSYWIGPRIMQ